MSDTISVTAVDTAPTIVFTVSSFFFFFGGGGEDCVSVYYKKKSMNKERVCIQGNNYKNRMFMGIYHTTNPHAIFLIK